MTRETGRAAPAPAGSGREARPASVALLTAAIGRPERAEQVAADLAASVADAPAAQQDGLAIAAVEAVLPRTAAWLVDRGLTPEQATASIADVARKRDRYGVPGTGLDWFCAVVTGRVVAVGRLQYEVDARLPDGSRGWGVHVPETGPLDPDACDRSFRAAPAVLRLLAPDLVAATWSCRSWTLDPGLAAALGPDANLVRFARRFTLLPPGPQDAEEGDHSVAKFVFGTSLTAARAAVGHGRVERAVLDRWAGGGHWTDRTGTAPVSVV